MDHDRASAEGLPQTHKQTHEIDPEASERLKFPGFPDVLTDPSEGPCLSARDPSHLSPLSVRSATSRNLGGFAGWVFHIISNSCAFPSSASPQIIQCKVRRDPPLSKLADERGHVAGLVGAQRHAPAPAAMAVDERRRAWRSAVPVARVATAHCKSLPCPYSTSGAPRHRTRLLRQTVRPERGCDRRRDCLHAVSAGAWPCSRYR